MTRSQLSCRAAHLTDFMYLRTWFATERELRNWGGAAVRFPFDERQYAAMLVDADSSVGHRRCLSFDRAGRLAAHGQLVAYPGGQSGRLSRLAVAPSLRGRGIGREMVTVLIDRAAADGISCLELNVYLDNRIACHLYRTLGFVEQVQALDAPAKADSSGGAIRMHRLGCDITGEPASKL